MKHKNYDPNSWRHNKHKWQGNKNKNQNYCVTQYSKQIWKSYPPSRCSLNTLSKARHMSNIVYSCACIFGETSSYVEIHHKEDFNFKQEAIFTPPSAAIGRPIRSSSALMSSIVLLIRAMMLGIFCLITTSKCWLKRTGSLASEFVTKQLGNAIYVILTAWWSIA